MCATCARRLDATSRRGWCAMNTVRGVAHAVRCCRRSACCWVSRCRTLPPAARCWPQRGTPLLSCLPAHTTRQLPPRPARLAWRCVRAQPVLVDLTEECRSWKSRRGGPNLPLLPGTTAPSTALAGAGSSVQSKTGGGSRPSFSYMDEDDERPVGVGAGRRGEHPLGNSNTCAAVTRRPF